MKQTDIDRQVCYIFESGRYRPANCGIIGIDENLSVSQGYDGDFYDDDTEEYQEEKLSKEDLKELADFMIERWSKFKEKHS